MQEFRLTSHERMDFKRCPRKWFWRWRKGLTPRATTFGALDLGTWIHEAFARWYKPGKRRTSRSLAEHFTAVASQAIRKAYHSDTPDHVIQQAQELAALGKRMLEAYEAEYGSDPNVYVIAPEVSLDFVFEFPDEDFRVTHLLKPDLVFRDRHGLPWLMENKTAASISIEHLRFDDQSGPYGAMATQGLLKAGLIEANEVVKGILYNFLRKAVPDERERNELGQYLNKNGTVSARQPPAYFKRHPVIQTRESHRITLNRLNREAYLIGALTKDLRNKTIDPRKLPKTPHKSCARFCEFFTMCYSEEDGVDIRDMQRSMYVTSDPYAYHDSTDEHASFEMG